MGLYLHDRSYGDTQYVMLRDALIPEAEKYCDSVLKVAAPSQRDGTWTRLFMRVMDRLYQVRSLERKLEQARKDATRMELTLARLREDLYERPESVRAA